MFLMQNFFELPLGGFRRTSWFLISCKTPCWKLCTDTLIMTQGSHYTGCWSIIEWRYEQTWRSTGVKWWVIPTWYEIELTFFLAIHIYMGGVGLQQFFIIVFSFFAVKFHCTLLQRVRQGVEGVSDALRLSCAIYGVLLLITVYASISM